MCFRVFHRSFKDDVLVIISLLIFWRNIFDLWSVHCDNLPTHLASRFKSLVARIPNKYSFNNLAHSRSSIIDLSRLFLPTHIYKWDINCSLFCTLHREEAIRDLSHIVFDCSLPSTKRLSTANIFNYFS